MQGFAIANRKSQIQHQLPGWRKVLRYRPNRVELLALGLAPCDGSLTQKLQCNSRFLRGWLVRKKLEWRKR